MVRLGNNEVLKILTKTLTLKFLVCDLDPKVTVMSADGAGKNVWPVYIMIPIRN